DADEPVAQVHESLADPAISEPADLAAESQPAPDAVAYSRPAVAVESGTPEAEEEPLVPGAGAAPLDGGGSVDQPAHSAAPGPQPGPAAWPVNNAPTPLPIGTSIRQASGTAHEDPLLAGSEPEVEAADAVLREQAQPVASVVSSGPGAAGGDPTEFFT